MNDQQALPWWQQSRLQLMAITGLVVLLLFVVFVLPNLVEPVTLTTQEQTNPSSGVLAPRPDDAPFADAQLARERKQAQEVLSQVLQLQDQLEGQQVQQWAAAAYQGALETALQADEYYRQRAFALAQEHYQSTLAQLQALKQQASEVLTQQLALGQAALADKDAAAAQKAFALALAIDTTHADARTGLASAEVLDQVLDLLRKGRLEEKTDHWPQALASYQQAQALDPNSALAREATETLQAKIKERRFTDAMSAGFKALDAGQYEQARQQFRQAGQIKPNEDSVGLALQQVANQSTLNAIQNRVKQARQAEQEERWVDANNLYKSVLETDSTVMDAMVGKLRTDARAELEQRTHKVLANGLELNKPDAMALAEKTLQDLNNLGQVLPRTAQQRQQLQALLDKARIPRQVLLQSDNLTQVTIYHVGRLGAFSEHALALTPGTYVAVGSRQGYKDVREEFVVALEATQVVVNIRCSERIALGG